MRAQKLWNKRRRRTGSRQAANETAHLRRRLVVVLRGEVGGRVPLGHRLLDEALKAVHAQAALHRLARGQPRHPRLHVRVRGQLQEVRGPDAVRVLVAHVQAANPRVDGHVRDRVFVAEDVLFRALGQVLVEHVEQPLRLHRVAVDRILVVHRRIREEVSEAAADERRGSHLPHQPVHALRPCSGAVGAREELTVLLRNVHQNGARLEETNRLAAAVVVQGRDLRVRVQRNEPASELLAADGNLPRVVVDAQLLQQDGHLLSVRRAERVQLVGVLPALQLLLLPGTGGGAVGAREGSTGGGRGLPHLRDDVPLRQGRLGGLRLGHCVSKLCW
eukprot:Rhum_TRINITY_DN22910_c0_g1::Rhum_TRINITY_DN22910_c0_g1_i1::g.176502::m.176502